MVHIDFTYKQKALYICHSLSWQ